MAENKDNYEVVNLHWLDNKARIRNEKKSENKKESSPKELGTAYNEYSGKPKEAIKHLLKNKSGYVPAEIDKDEIGDIDFVWGEHDTANKIGYGLAHILSRGRNEDFIKTIPEII